MTPDGRTILVLEYRLEFFKNSQGLSHSRSGYLSRWELATGERKSRDAIGSHLLDSVFSPDGRLLVAGNALLDTATKKRCVLLESGDKSSFGGCYAFSGDGRRVAGLITREDDERHISEVATGIQVWDTETGRTLRCIRFAPQGECKFSTFASGGVAPLALSPDGRYVAATDEWGLWVWESATGQVLLKRSNESMGYAVGVPIARCLAFSPDGLSLATGNVDSTVLIWDLAQSRRKR